MAISRTIQIEETENGGLFVIVEFRHDPSDPEPFHANDFHWHDFPVEKQVPDLDSFGRLLIGGKRRFPASDIDMTKVRMSTYSLSDDEIKDKIWATVQAYAERNGLHDPATIVHRDDTRAVTRRPSTKSRGQTRAALRRAQDGIVGTSNSDSKADIHIRQQKRKR